MEGTPTAAAAPATAAPAAPFSPSGGNTPAERPTFESVFAADASPASDPSTAATASPEGPAAPSSEATPGDDRSPLIPRARFDEVVTARKAAEAQAQSLREVLGDIAPDQARDILQGIAKHRHDPLGFFEQEASSMPAETALQLLQRISTAIRQRYPDELRSFVGRQLAEQRVRQEPQLETVAAEMPDGKVVNLVTADSIAKREAWLREQVKREQQEALQPILSERDQRAKAEAAKAVEAQQQHWVHTTVTDALSWPGMDAEPNRQALGHWLAEQTQGRDVSGHAMERLIDRGYRTVVQPRLMGSAESKLLDTLQQKAHASSGVAPGQAAPAATTRPRSFEDPSLKW